VVQGKIYFLTCCILKMNMQVGRCFIFFNIKERYYSLWKFAANKTACRFTWYWFSLPSFYLWSLNLLLWHQFGLWVVTPNGMLTYLTKLSLLIKMPMRFYKSGVVFSLLEVCAHLSHATMNFFFVCVSVSRKRHLL